MHELIGYALALPLLLPLHQPYLHLLDSAASVPAAAAHDNPPTPSPACVQLPTQDKQEQSRCTAAHCTALLCTAAHYTTKQYPAPPHPYSGCTTAHCTDTPLCHSALCDLHRGVSVYCARWTNCAVSRCPLQCTGSHCVSSWICCNCSSSNCSSNSSMTDTLPGY